MAEQLFGGLRTGQIVGLREEFPDLASQQWLAPLEHQGYAHEVASENPLRGLGLIAGIPAYQAAKGVGLMGSRTGSSQPLKQMAAGYKGLGQGFGLALRRMMESVISPAAAAAPSIERPEAVGASPIDARGDPQFGLRGFPGVAPAPVAPVPARSFESDYDRELRALRGGQNSIGGTSIFTK
jgi:hypothetical protein